MGEKEIKNPLSDFIQVLKKYVPTLLEKSQASLKLLKLIFHKFWGTWTLIYPNKLLIKVLDALSTTEQTYQSLLNDDQILSLCLSYFITTLHMYVCKWGYILKKCPP